MGDKNIDNNIDSNIDSNVDESENEDEAGSGSEEEQDEKSDDGSSGSEDDGQGKDDKKSEEKSDDEFKDDGEEPLGRHKKNDRYAKMRIAKKEAKKKDTSEDDEEDNSEDEDDDLGEDEEKVIQKYFKKHGYDEKFKEVDTQKEQSMLSEFLSKPENKMFAPFKDKIWRISQHPTRKNLPFSSVAWEVAGPHLLKMGAQLQKQADEKAKSKSSGGTQSKSSSDGGYKPVEQMSDKEFQAYLLDIKSGNIKK
jgi:hypothetical protein